MNKSSIKAIILLLFCELSFLIQAVQYVDVLVYASPARYCEMLNLKNDHPGDLSVLCTFVEQNYPNFATIKNRYAATIKNVGENLIYLLLTLSSVNHIAISLELADDTDYNLFFIECSNLTETLWVINPKHHLCAIL